MIDKAKAPALGGARGSTHRQSSRAGNSQNSKVGHAKQSRSIDYAGLNSAAMAQMFWLLHRLLPGGILRGSEYTVRNPTRADKTPGSFSVNTKTGKWSDFAVHNARGGDIVSLVAYINGSSQSTAARYLADILGMRA